MLPEEFEFTTVWSGSDVGVYLGALKGVEPFMVKEIAAEQISKSVLKTRRISTLILQILRKGGPMTQSQLASACNRAASETKKALCRLAGRGLVELEQPCLLAIEPHDGQRWRVK